MARWWLVYVLSIFLLLGLSGESSDSNVQIKIMESSSVRYPSWPSSSRDKLVLRTQPNAISGPPHLQQLAGQCFEASYQGYTYEVCPFHNVTQKEDRVSWNSFHGVLGVWKEWLMANDTFAGMLFAMGEACGGSDREAKVLFNCSTITRLHNISEPSSCSYVLWMDTPLACFKGAMQVYHVLSENQLSEWEALNLEYHSGEITFQGLSNKRKRLLTEAGLAQEFTKQKQPAEEQPVDQDNVVASETPLALCEKEKVELQSKLSDLRERITDVLRDHPSIHLDSELQHLLQFDGQDGHDDLAPVDGLGLDLPKEEELAELMNEVALNEQLALLDDTELRELMED